MTDEEARLIACNKEVTRLTKELAALRKVLEKIAAHDGSRWAWKDGVAEPQTSMQELAKAALAATGEGETEIDQHGVQRYKNKPIMRWLGDAINLNDMWVAFQQGAFAENEFRQFYHDIGYSVTGFDDVWAEASSPATDSSTVECPKCGGTNRFCLRVDTLTGHTYERMTCPYCVDGRIPKPVVEGETP